MIKNKTIRKPKFSKTLLKCLLSMAAVAIIICVLFTATLNSILKNTIALSESMLLEDIHSAFTNGFDPDSDYMCLDSASSINVTVNEAPKSIGRDVAIFVDGKLYTYTNGGFTHNLQITDIDTDTVLEISDGSIISIIKIKGSYENSESPLFLYRDYADQSIIESVFPVFSGYFFNGDSPDVIQCVVTDENGDEDSDRLVISSYVDDPVSYDESKFTENLGDVRVFYDAAGNVHTYAVKATPNIYIKNIFQNTKGAMFIIYALVLVLCLIIGAILSVIFYYRSKNIYDAFTYRTDLTNALAHDLKTPLMAISSYAENYGASSDSSKKDYYVGKISENVSYMDNLIAGALSLSKAESSEEVIKEDFNVKAVVDEVLEQLSSNVLEKNLKVNVNNLKDNKITSDKIIFKSAIVSLLENSVKYAKPSSEIVVSSSDSEILKIVNSFEGEIENKDKLKEAFIRGNKARGENDGFGLGLSIADKKLGSLGLNLDISIDGDKFTSVVK